MRVQSLASRFNDFPAAHHATIRSPSFPVKQEGQIHSSTLPSPNVPMPKVNNSPNAVRSPFSQVSFQQAGQANRSPTVNFQMYPQDEYPYGNGTQTATPQVSTQFLRVTYLKNLCNKILFYLPVPMELPMLTWVITHSCQWAHLCKDQAAARIFFSRCRKGSMPTTLQATLSYQLPNQSSIIHGTSTSSDAATQDQPNIRSTAH